VLNAVGLRVGSGSLQQVPQNLDEGAAALDGQSFCWTGEWRKFSPVNREDPIVSVGLILAINNAATDLAIKRSARPARQWEAACRMEQ
jgi:hypothetical protein